MMTLLRTFASYFQRQPDDRPRYHGKLVDGDKLIVRTDVFVEALCPCGSQHIHRLTLFSTSECARCGRTIAVRSIEYHRVGPDEIPTPQITIGFVMTEDALHRRETHGVH